MTPGVRMGPYWGMGKTHGVLAALMLATAVGAGLFFGLWRPAPPGVVPAAGGSVVTLAPAPSVGTALAGENWIVVHVAGRVLHPGLVRVEASARVGDAIRAAGGALADARLGEINLAAPVSDGGRLVVPGPGAGPVRGEAWNGSGPDFSDRVSLNRAGPHELERVPGLGPVLAERIVAHRENNGPYREVEDLLDVSGIGEKKLAELREHVVLP